MFEFIEEISYLIKLMILMFLPLFLLAIEIIQIRRTRTIEEKTRRMYDVFAMFFAFIPLETYISKSLSMDKTFMVMITDTLGSFLCFLFIFAVSEAYVKYGLPFEFIKSLISPILGAQKR